MSLTLLALVLACSVDVPGRDTVPSPNGRFILELTPDALTLTERGVKQPRWTAPARRWITQYAVADSGQWVLALESSACPDCAWATRFDAHGSETSPKLKELLSEEEQQDLGESSCGVAWLRGVKVVGDVVTLTVNQGGNRPPIYEPGPSLSLRLDALRGTVTRGPPVARPGIAELIRAHQQEDQAGRAFEALQLKARLTSSRGDRALCGFFAPFSQGDDARRRSDAIRALSAAGCEREWAALVNHPRGDDGDLATFEGLSGRDPAAAAQYALTALRERRAPELLRRRAVVLLVTAESPACFEAARLAASDPEPEVRASAVYQLGRLPLSPEAFGLLLGLAGPPSSHAVAARALVRRYLEDDPRGGWGAPMLKAVLGGTLDDWGAGLIIGGGLGEVRGDPAAAARLYERGLPLVEAQRPSAGAWNDAQLWAEAKLRLAQLAADAGRKDTALRLANEVLTSGLRERVAAPRPNRYAGGIANRTADVVAQQMVDSGGAPVPPPPAPKTMLQQHQELLRRQQEALQLMREQRKQAGERRKEREARRRQRQPSASDEP